MELIHNTKTRSYIKELYKLFIVSEYKNSTRKKILNDK